MQKLFYIVVICLSISFKISAQYSEPHFGGEFVSTPDECICLTEDQRQRIITANRKSKAELIAQRKLIIQKSAAVSFNWPLQHASNLTDYSYYGISNY